MNRHFKTHWSWLMWVVALAFAGPAAASLVHTYTSGTDVPVSAAGYVATGSLDLTLAFTPTPGASLTVVKNTGPAFISGTFGNVAQGATVPLVFNGITYDYIANYYGGNGRSLVLQWPLIGLAAWGSNQNGQLGTNETLGDSVYANVAVGGALAGKTVVAVAAGETHSLALTADGRIFGWGANGYGQLGNGTSTYIVREPVATDMSGALVGKTVVAVAAGSSHSLALTADGQVFAWGDNSSGQLGINVSSLGSPVAVAVYTDGALSGKTVVAIAAGTGSSTVLTSDGKVFSWGSNFYGQLGNNTTTSSSSAVAVDTGGVLSGKTVVAITSGFLHGMALTSEGKVVAWGYNLDGELGNNTTTNSLVPVAVSTSGVLFGKTVVAIARGNAHSLALTSDGKVFGWGGNSSGQLGNNSTSTSLIPVAAGGDLVGKTVVSLAAGSFHSLALTVDGQAFIWGDNTRHVLGNNNPTGTPSLVPEAMTGIGPAAGKTVTAISAGSGHNVVLIDAGPPHVSANPLHLTATSGATVTFTAAATHSFPFTVRWQASPTGAAGPFTDITGNPSAITTTLSLPGISPAQNGSAYRAIFTNLSGSSTTTAANLSLVNWTATFTAAGEIPFSADQVVASGSLAVQLGFTPAPGTNLTVIRNNGPALIAGVFDNVPQGAIVPLTFNGVTYNYFANYYGGNGRSLVFQWPNTGLAAWGYGGNGELGNGLTNSQNISPLAVNIGGAMAGKTIVALSAGSHNLALTADGLLFAWGDNFSGQLGNNSTVDSLTPIAIGGGALAGKTVVAVAAGGSHSLALTADGQVFAWGANGAGQLGNGSTTSSLVPVAVGGALAGKTVTAIATGGTHNLALTSDGQLFAWGANTYGQLGNRTSNTNSLLPVAVITNGALDGKTVVAIGAGIYHSMALTLDGGVFTWGSNSYGALGNNGPTYENATVPVAVVMNGALTGKTVASIAAGGLHNLALTSDGKVFAWGNNSYGQLGNNSTLQSAFPVAVSTGGILAGKVLTAVAAGYQHSLALASDGLVFSWGYNGSGELGNNDWSTSLLPVPVNTSGLLAGKNVAVIETGTAHNVAVFGTGAPTVTLNPVNQMAAAGSTVAFSADATDPFGFSIRWQVSANGSGGPFIDIAGNATATGKILTLADVGPSQNGSAYRAVFTNGGGSVTPPPATLTLVNWTATWTSPADIPYQAVGVVASGSLDLHLEFAPTPGTNLTLVKNTGTSFIGGSFDNIPQGGRITLTYNGVTYDFIANYYGGNGRSLVLQWPWMRYAAWGANGSGQLGNGGTSSSQVPVAATFNTGGILADKALLSAVTGGNHDFALTADGKLYAWGANSYGQLGNNSTTTSQSPVAVNTGGVLAGKTMVAAAASERHSLGLTSDGQVFAWGNNFYGQLGNGTTTNSPLPVAVSTAGALAGKTIVAVSAGTTHSLALSSEGRVFAWGSNGWGQLGTGNGANSPVPLAVANNGELSGKTVVAIAAGDSHSVALTSDGLVFTWGFGSRLGANSTADSQVPVAVNTSGGLAGKTVVAIAAGGSHSMALTADGQVFAWGDNFYGQLGNNNTSDGSIPVAVESSGPLAGKTVVAIAAGASHSLAVTADGQGVSWGYNYPGQLGNNTIINSPVPIAVDTSGVLAGKTLLQVDAGYGHSLVMYGSQGSATITANPENQTLLQSAPTTHPVSFIASAVDIFPLSIQWQVSNAGTAGPFFDIVDNATATTGTLTLPDVTSADHGHAYRAIFTNNGGTGASAPATLSVLTVNTAVNFATATAIPMSAVSPSVSGPLNITLGFAPAPGTTLTLLRNTGFRFITGAFDNLAQGATVPLTFNGITHQFVANYYGDNGRSLVLQWAATELAAWGSNSVGQLGNGSTTSSRLPVAVTASGVLAGKTITAVASGISHNLALTVDGKVLAWGAGGSGQLGNAATSSSSVPVMVDTTGILAGKTVVAVATGDSHNLALTSEGKVVAWGLNTNGRLGNNSTATSSIPVAVDTSGALAGKTVIAVAAGSAHSLALTSEGRIYAWGLNVNTTASSVPVEVFTGGVLAGKTVVAIAAADAHSLALTSDGRLYSWGSNKYGQLGNFGTVDSTNPVAVYMGSVFAGKTVTAIAAGSRHCKVLTSDGNVFCWGDGNFGKLGNNSSSLSASPVAVSTSGVLSGKSVVRIAAGFDHSLVVTSDGKPFAWGKNSAGQVGDNTLTDRFIPVALTTSGSIGGKSVIAMAGGGTHSVALLGTGTAPAVTVNPADRTVAATATVSFNAAATGYPAPTVRWQRSTTGPTGTFSDITGNSSATTGTLVLPNVTTTLNGYAYRAIFTNSDASATTTAALLSVYPPPQITVPANITASATDKSGAVVAFDVTVNDSLDGPLVPLCTPPSGSVFPIGVTTVNCSATNSLGGTSTASFAVTVQRTFEAFMDFYGLPGSDPLADPQQTGLSNLLAYAFGMNPTAPDRSQMPVATLVGGYYQISYPRWKDAGDLGYVVEVGDNPDAWNSGSGYTQQLSVTSIDATRERVVERDLTPASNAPHRFFRVRITR